MNSKRGVGYCPVCCVFYSVEKLGNNCNNSKPYNYHDEAIRSRCCTPVVTRPHGAHAREEDGGQSNDGSSRTVRTLPALQSASIESRFVLRESFPPVRPEARCSFVTINKHEAHNELTMWSDAPTKVKVHDCLFRRPCLVPWLYLLVVVPMTYRKKLQRERYIDCPRRSTIRE